MPANIDRYHAAVEAFNARDIEALIETFHPEIEFHSIFAGVGGAVYHGHAGIRRWHQDLEETWGSTPRLEPEVYFDLGGDQMLAFHVYRARGAQSGIEVSNPLAHIATFRDGRVIELKTYAARADVLRDLGLSEAELEPIEPPARSAGSSARPRPPAE